MLAWRWLVPGSNGPALLAAVLVQLQRAVSVTLQLVSGLWFHDSHSYQGQHTERACRART
jgi:hypothetical protein